MSTLPLTIVLLVQIICFYTVHARLTQQFFYGVEWTSFIPTTELVLGQTMSVHEISLISNNHIVQHPPTVIGFQDASALTDGTHSTSTYPTKHTFSVKWHFDGQLVPIDLINIFTNCGDDNPSLYCNHTQLVFNTSNNGREFIEDVNYLANIIRVPLFHYENDCHNNTLLLDTESSINPSCSWECEECLRFLNVDITHNTMNTSSYINLFPSSSNCQCPSFTLTHTDDNQFKVWQHGSNFMGVLVPNGNSDRLQMSWVQWMGQETSCRQSYLPNTDDFMSVPSFKALELEFTFNHTNGPLYQDYESDQTQVDEFRMEIEEFLDALFNLTWVYEVLINPNTSYPDVNTYSYIMNIKSIGTNSLPVVWLSLEYNTSYDSIVDGFIEIISDSFDTNSSFIDNLYGVDDIILSDDDECSSYFLTTTAPPKGKKDDVVAIVISVSVASVGLLIAAILLLVCYKRHLACFKIEWDTEKGKDPDRNPDEIYKNQKEVGKKGKKKMMTASKDTKQGSINSTKPVGQHAPSSHVKSVSIPICILNENKQLPQTSLDPACLRLQSMTLANNDSIVIIDQESNPAHPVPKRIKKGVSERIVVPVSYPPINASVRAADIGDVGFAKGLTVDGGGGAVYVDSAPASVAGSIHGYDYSGRQSGTGYDYASQRNSNATTKHGHHNKSSYDYRSNRNSGKSGYDALSQYSSSPDLDGHYVETQQIQLHNIEQDRVMNGPSCQPVNKASKIDDELDKVKRSNKVIEFKEIGNELKLIKIIGEGSFGKVYKAKWDAEFVAVKIFTNVAPSSVSTNKIEVASTMGTLGAKGLKGSANGNFALSNLEIKSIDDEQYKELYAEIVLATSIPPHPNIVRINGFCRHPLCVVMEFMAGGSVQKLVYGLTKRPVPSVMEKFVILVKSCYGLAKLTEYNLHHRDVAARNILLGEYQDVIDSGTKVKITDFGMTRKDDENTRETQKTKSDGGPFKWMAPESIQKQIYNEKTDVYMFGITIWEIMYGTEPYENMDAINTAMNVCMKDERPEFLWDLPSGLKTLIKKCWDKDPDKRLTFKEVARKLQKLQSNLQSDIKENQAMDKVVEDENTMKALNRVSSLVTITNQYEDFE